MCARRAGLLCACHAAAAAGLSPEEAAADPDMVQLLAQLLPHDGDEGQAMVAEAAGDHLQEQVVPLEDGGGDDDGGAWWSDASTVEMEE